MKIKSAISSSFLFFWTVSSLLGAPSKQLLLKDSVRYENPVDLNLSQGSFSGKMAQTAAGNIIVVSNEMVEWKDGDEVFNTNIFEWNPLNQETLAAYKTMSPDGETPITVSDLVFDSSANVYYGLDQENMMLYSFEFGPDTEKTVIVEQVRTVDKIRMVELVVVPDMVNVSKELVPLEIPSEEPSEEPVPLDVDENTVETVVEEVSDVDTSENATDKVKTTQSKIVFELSKKEDQVETSTVSEALVTAEKVETPAVDEVVVPIPTTEWIEEVYQVEETYDAETVVAVSHRFGNALQAFDLSSYGLGVVIDMLYESSSHTIFLLAESEDGYAAILSLQIQESGSIDLVKVAKISDEQPGDVLSLDPYSKLWVISGDGGNRIYSRDGRLVRLIESPIEGLSDICSVPVFAEDGSVSGIQTYASVDGSIGSYVYEREGEEQIHHVPGEFASIQAAFDQAESTDWILLAPGTYDSGVLASGKEINVVSYYQTTEDLYFLENTVIQPIEGPAVILEDLESSSLYLSGIKITGATVGIQSNGNLTVENLEIKGNEIGVELNGGTALLSDSEISGNSGNGITYQSATATLVERCLISENGKHGVEIAITPYDGVLFRTVIRRNDIVENGAAGLFFADAPITTNREFRIENNFFIRNKTAGLEVYMDQPDPKNLIPTGPRTKNSVHLVNNTIVGSPVGVLRGGNYRMINNIVSGCDIAGVSRLKYHSVLIRNIFWENELISVESNYNSGNNREVDPMFVGDDYILSVRSPAKGAGIPGNLWNDKSDRSGADIGASR